MRGVKNLAKEKRLVQPIKKMVVLIPTNTINESDPRGISERARARLTAGMHLIRTERLLNGNASVLAVLFGGWALHEGWPLALHHSYAAELEGICQPGEINLITAFGVNTTSDLVPTVEWIQRHTSGFSSATVVTSTGHANRLIEEAALHEVFTDGVWHFESGEPRSNELEDANWTERARTVHAHEFNVGRRKSDVARFGARDALAQASIMEGWARDNQNLYSQYCDEMSLHLMKLEKNFTTFMSNSPGCKKIAINY